jgi:hypothetical protein
MITVGHDLIPPGCHELLVTVERALEKGEGNISTVAGTLRVLLQSGEAPRDADCSLLASVLADAVEVSNDPGDGS